MQTFFFSDIEGSTGRWERHRDAMAHALARHDAIVRDAIEHNGGKVFKNLGDGFCAVFADPALALASAVAAQRAIASEEWADVGGLAIRIALHCGEAEERNGDYFGRPVNRVARLLSAAHGGQTLASAAVAHEREAFEDIQLRPLGTFTLKDLREPELVYQVVAADLPYEFPALRTLEAVPNNLPIQFTSLVGRAGDIVAIGERLRRATLVTITGPGGVGKTRVALQSAADAVDRFDDGVWFVNLAPLRGTDSVAEAMLAALGVPGSSGQSASAQLVAFLRDRQTLLVVDNCEHLVQAVAHEVDAVRRSCARVAFLCTSRESLHVAGESVYALSPLEHADAAELFVRRAQIVGTSDVGRARDAIEAICERLDGIPLAIELAAARTRILRPDQIAARLDERFRLLAGGPRTALARQQTLAATIEWSYELLDERERRFFRFVGAFRGTFSLDAATAVATEHGDELEALDLLTSLTDKSLVVATPGNARYRLLETVREFAALKLTERAERETAAAVHARYFAACASEAYEQFDRALPEGWLDGLGPDIDNFRAALHRSFADGGDARLAAQLAADCGPIFLRLHLLREGIQWCERAAAIEDLPPQTLGRISYVASMMYNNAGDSIHAQSTAERAVAAYRLSDDVRGLVRALSQAARQNANLGAQDAASKYAEEAIVQARALAEPRVLLGVLRRSAAALAAQDVGRSRILFAEALQLARQAEDNEETVSILEWWADAEYQAGHPERAMRLIGDALAAAAEDAKPYLLATAALCALACEEYAAAAQYAKDGAHRALTLENDVLVAMALTCYAAAVADDASAALPLYAFGIEQLERAHWNLTEYDRKVLENARTRVSSSVERREREALLARGQAWTLRQAEDAFRSLLAVRDAASNASSQDGTGSSIETLLR